MEFAGNANTSSTSRHSQWLQTQASTNWNTDTGATSHMTPHKHWFRSYSPHIVPIRLANNTQIYSAGLGSIEFQPIIGDVPGRPIVLHDVLHVPDLGSNLLSLFHLTRAKGYKVLIESDQVQFTYQGHLHFTATVNNHNIGYLNVMSLFQVLKLLSLPVLVPWIYLYGIVVVPTSTLMISSICTLRTLSRAWLSNQICLQTPSVNHAS